MLIGIVGKPNVGKSTFFKSATLSDVDIANYPFTTLKANEGVGYISTECQDKFFDLKCTPKQGYCVDSTRFIPVRLIDTPGLIPGANEGKGLGNMFLDSLQPADVLIHVVDASGSTNEMGEPVTANTHDPINDINFLEKEIDLWYAKILQGGWKRVWLDAVYKKERLHVAIAQHFGSLRIRPSLLETILEQENITTPPQNWAAGEFLQLARAVRRETKPIIIAANKADVACAENNIKRIKELYPNHIVVPCYSDYELALRGAAKRNILRYIPGKSEFKIKGESSLTEKQQSALAAIVNTALKTNGSTGIQASLNAAIYGALKHITVYPGWVNEMKDTEGKVLPDAFLMPPKSTVLDFADKIHSDLAKNVIHAVHVKTRQKIAKDCELKDGDVIQLVLAK